MTTQALNAIGDAIESTARDYPPHVYVRPQPVHGWWQVVTAGEMRPVACFAEREDALWFSRRQNERAAKERSNRRA